MPINKTIPINTELLASIAARIDGNGLWDTKWQNCEAEMIVYQTVMASHRNLKNHGDAFSWASRNVFNGLQMCGTNNSHGLALVGDDIIVEEYDGPAKPLENTIIREGKPLVFRVTNNLLQYLDKIA